MQTRRLNIIGSGLALALLFLIAMNDGQMVSAQMACTVTIQPGQSIQQTIDGMADGAVVCLAAGRFQENLEITKSLVLQGASREQTEISSDEHRFPRPIISVDGLKEIHVVIEGLSIDGAAGDGMTVNGTVILVIHESQISTSRRSGLHVLGSAAVTVADSQFANNALDGLSVEGSGEVSLANSQITGNTQGIFSTDAAIVAVANSRLSDNLIGLQMDSSAPATLINSEISHNRSFGIEAGASAQVSLIDSQITDNRVGLGAERSATVQIQESAVKDQKGCGIWVFSDEAQVQGNPELSGNGVDLCGYASASSRIPLVPQTDRTQLSVPDAYKTIQEAIDAVAPGGTILVQTGSFEAGLTIWKPLTLRGAGRSATTLKALSGREIALSIIAGVQGVLLEDITVTGAADLGIFSTPTAGLLIYGQADLDHIQISGNGRDGLFVGGSAAAWLVHSEISNNRGNGLTVSNLAQVAIKDSTISGSGLNGLNIRGSAQGALQDCQISGNAFQGIEVIDSATVSISDCRITDNRLNGLSINDSATVTLQSVQVSGNGQDGLYAARGFFGDSAVIIVQDSQVSSNEHDGLAIVQSARVRLFGNTVRDNKQYGIHPDSVANITACSANTATHNGINYNSAAAQKCNQ